MNERAPGARFTSFTNGIDPADAFSAENSRFDFLAVPGQFGISRFRQEFARWR